jgi:hypothetical protein
MAKAAQMLRDKWTLLVLREAFSPVTCLADNKTDLGVPPAMLEKRRAGRRRHCDCQIRRCTAVVRTLLLMAVLTLQASVVTAQEPRVFYDPAAVTIFLVGHTEMDLSIPSIPLTAEGVERAAKLVPVFDHVRLTHVFTSHTARSQQTVAAVAEAHNLELIALPALGTRIGSDTVTGRSPSRVAIAPLVGALRSLPSGSTVLVAGNSGNLFAIMHGLGVPVATGEHACVTGDTCVPCLDNACFPEDFDNLWILTLSGATGSTRLQWLKY